MDAFPGFIEFPDGARIAYSAIVRSTTSRIRFLRKHHGSRGAIRCLCRAEPLPLGVAHRRTPTDTYYLYSLTRADRKRHSPACPLRKLPIRGTPRSRPLPRIEYQRDRVVLHLAEPAYRLISAPDVELDDLDSNDRADFVSGPISSDLRMLWEVLWSRAELNRWHPLWAGKRQYSTVRFRLQRASEGIHLGDRCRLAEVLHIPPGFSVPRKEGNLLALTDFLGTLTPRGGRAPYGFFVGEVGQIREGKGGGRAIRLKHSPVLLWMSRPAFGRLVSRSFAGAEPRAWPRTWVVAQASRKGPSGWLKVRDATLLHLTREWIPVLSWAEHNLADQLVKEARRFRRPLASEPGTQPSLLPSFVLEDRADCMALEVWDCLPEPQAATRFAHKRTLYESTGQPVFWWRPTAGPSPSALPPPDRS